MLGHASIAITKDVYGHLLEGDNRAAAESMSRALFGGPNALVGPSLAPKATRKVPRRCVKEPLSWARSERFGAQPF